MARVAAAPWRGGTAPALASAEGLRLQPTSPAMTRRGRPLLAAGNKSCGRKDVLHSMDDGARPQRAGLRSLPLLLFPDGPPPQKRK